MTLTILRKDKNTTARNLLIPIDDLGLAQRPVRKNLVRVTCKQSYSTQREPSYSLPKDCQQDWVWSFHDPAIFFSRHPAFCSRITMRKPDQIGALAIAFSLFVFYLLVAKFMQYFGSVSLPLGTFDNFVFSVLVVIYAATSTLYAIRQRERA